MTQSGWAPAGQQDVPAPEPRYRSRRQLRDEREHRDRHDDQDVSGWEDHRNVAAGTGAPDVVDLRDERAGHDVGHARDIGHARDVDHTRDVRRARGVPGPTTQELALYGTREPPAPVPPHRPASMPHGRPPSPSPSPSNRLARWDDLVGTGSRRERVRESAERWSRWASGLGLPARDGRGYERYARADRRLIPPAVWIAVALGLAGVVGLLTGVLVASPSSSGAAQATALPTPTTVTVTRQVTQAPVTETTTRTTTKTVTATMAAPNPAAVPGLTLGPGSSGPEVVRLQADLAALGVYAGQPTGTYDGPTIVAVQAFQARQGVTGDPPGVAGQATLQAIDHALGR